MDFEPIKKKTKKRKKYICIFIIILCLFLFIYSSYKTTNYFLETKKTIELTEEVNSLITTIENEGNSQTTSEEQPIKEQTINYEVNFNSLKQKNSDVVAFLKINGTNIEYVVVKGEDNSYYLTHNLNKEKNAAGWVFADYRNKFDGTDKNIIIYAHNMKNGTMFGTLKNILTNEWYEQANNKYITFVDEFGSHIYEVFSVYEIEKETYYMKTYFDVGEFSNYANVLKSRSKFYYNVNLGMDDQILTLSTCATNNQHRVILHAKKIN